MKKIAELEIYELLLISMFGLALADLLSGALKSLFFNTLPFKESSFKDSMMVFLLPLLIFLIVVFLAKPPPESLF